MAANTKILAFGIVVGATILGIIYHLTVSSPALHWPPIPIFPVRNPPPTPNTSIIQSFKQSIIQTITSIIEPSGSESDKQKKLDDDPFVLARRKERLHFILHAQQQRVNLTVGELFRLFPPVFTCPWPYKEERLGGDYNGKWACGIRELYGIGNKWDSKSPSSPIPNCVMYSFGVGSEVAFDEAVYKITNCEVFPFDHTVLKGIPSQSSESKDTRQMAFKKTGVEQYKNQNITHLKTIKQLMDINGHDWIDILNVDANGAEYDSLNVLMDDFEGEGILPFDQLLVQVHLLDPSSVSVYTKLLSWFNRLEAMGLRAVHAEKNAKCVCYEYSFVNVRGRVFQNSTFSFLKMDGVT